MKKFFSVGFATLGSLLLILIIVFTTLQLVINNETYVNNEFTKLELNTRMGMSNSDLVRSMMRLVDYMEGREANIELEVTVNGEKTQMFELEQEVEHMKDVRAIYQRIRTYRDTGVLVMLILFLFGALINFRKAPQTLAHGYLSGFFISLLFFGFLGTWAAMDFSSFWTFFHQMLFWNDLWLFDATESRMINMLPEAMFSDIVGRVFLYAGIALLLLLVLAFLAILLSSSAYKRRRAEALKRKKAREQARIARDRARAEAQAEKEKAKRIARKKAQRAQMKKRQEKEEQAARKKTERQAGKAARTRGSAPDDRAAEGAAYEDALYDGQEGDSLLIGAEQQADRASQAAPVVEARPSLQHHKKKRRPAIKDDTGFLDEDD